MKWNKLHNKSITEILVLICSIVAVIIALIALDISRRTYDLAINEDLTISTNHLRQNYRTSISLSNDNLNILRTKWEINITNNSSNPISIIDFKIINNLTSLPKVYHLINPFILNDNSDPLKIPFFMEPGISKSIIAEIGIVLKIQISGIIEKKFKNINDFKIKDLIDTLSLNQIDMFGDPVLPVIQENVIFGIRDPTGVKNEQTFSLILKTAKGKLFVSKMSIYE